MSEYIGEATAYDKKMMLERKEPLSWLKSISAFANTSGGVLLYGVDNGGNLVGLENAERDAEDISEMVKCLMDPVPEFTLSLHKEDGRKFVMVSVKAGTETPYYVFIKGHRDAYIRIGNESVKANSIDLKRLVLKARNDHGIRCRRATSGQISLLRHCGLNTSHGRSWSLWKAILILSGLSSVEAC